MSHQKLMFVITYLLEDEQELSLGMLIRCKRIYNFWCSLLVLHQFLYVLFTLRCTFYAFSGTNLFSAVFVFQKSCTGNILGTGRNKSRSSYFHVTKTESEGESKRSHRAATPGLGAASMGPTPRVRVGPPGLCRLCPFAHIFSVSGKP